MEDLAQAAGRALDRVVFPEEVFSALDFLADAGLIEERVAPPVAEGKVSRRSLLVRMAPVVGAAAWMVSGASARAGGQTEQYNKEAIEKESGAKEQLKESRGKSREHDLKERFRVSNEQNKRKIDHTGKYAVGPKHPLVGTWKHVESYSTLLWIISADGIESFHLLESYGNSDLAINNWKYISTGPRTGVMEEFVGELISRGDIRWIGNGWNEFEFTATSDTNAKLIGQRTRYVRAN